MPKYNFSNDYSEGCHPSILDALAASNLVQEAAYGADSHSERARELIHHHLQRPQSEIFFVSGGTTANLLIAACSLRSHEAVIAPATGHIVTNEAGAIEATGHKIFIVPSQDGKMSAEDLQTALSTHTHFPHIARPRLVYLTNASEVGTIYSRGELAELSAICRQNNLLLMMDGARLGAALAAESNDLTLADIAELTDVFWIGGTKAGALIGEAIVINNSDLAVDFAFHLKQRGALLAKGRLLGIQFERLFTDDLYFHLSRHANQMAKSIAVAIEAAGYEFAAPPQANQVFAILPNDLVERLSEKYVLFVRHQHGDSHKIVRIVTSWATNQEAVSRFAGEFT